MKPETKGAHHDFITLDDQDRIEKNYGIINPTHLKEACERIEQLGINEIKVQFLKPDNGLKNQNKYYRLLILEFDDRIYGIAPITEEETK